MEKRWLLCFTLSGLFFIRGLCFADTTEVMSIDDQRNEEQAIETPATESQTVEEHNSEMQEIKDLTAEKATTASQRNKKHNINFNYSGFVGFEVGQIVKGYSWRYSREIKHAWQERMLFQFVNDIAVTERIRLIMAVECQMSFSYPQDITEPQTRIPQFSFYPDRVEATYSLGDLKEPYLEFGMGYFPYKFNPDARNLGEFIFRSGTYPQWILTSFNRPYTRLLGLRISSTLWGSLHQDILLTSEALQPPTQDFSLSYLANYSLLQFFDIGAGITWAHLFSIQEKEYPYTDPEEIANSYIKENGDTAYYTFRGTKPAARLALNPRRVLPFMDHILGEYDLRIYGEVCVIGWKNYKNYNPDTNTIQYYDKRSDRTKWMIGFNFPTFAKAIENISPKLPAFEVLTMEWEYWGDRFSSSSTLVSSLPIPYLVQPTPGINPWKFSIYAKLNFLERFSLIGQIARDHMRPINHNMKLQEITDVTERAGDWWWVLRLNASY